MLKVQIFQTEKKKPSTTPKRAVGQNFKTLRSSCPSSSFRNLKEQSRESPSPSVPRLEGEDGLGVSIKVWEACCTFAMQTQK